MLQKSISTIQLRGSVNALEEPGAQLLCQECSYVILSLFLSPIPLFYVINIFKLLQCVLMGTGVWDSCLLVFKRAGAQQTKQMSE